MLDLQLIIITGDQEKGGQLKKNSFLDILLVFRGLTYCWQQRGKWEPLVCMFVRFLLVFLLALSLHHPESPSMHYHVGVAPSVQHPRSYWTCKGHKLYKINACVCDVKNTNHYFISQYPCSWLSIYRVLYWIASSVCWIIFCKQCKHVAFLQLATMCMAIDHREKWKLMRSLFLQAPQFWNGWIPCCDLANW